MSSLKILHVTSELTPYSSENSVSTSVYNLAKKMHDEGNDVRIFMPKFGIINERRFQLHEVIRLSGMNIIINDLDQPLIIKVASLPGERMQCYFIDNDEFFKRKYTYGDETQKWFEDNNERAVFFAKGVLETVKKLNWMPDIIHVHGWMGALLPLYIKKYYQNDVFFEDIQLVYSAYNHVANEKLADNLTEILAFDGITNLAHINKENFVYNLAKEAMYHSDVSIKGEGLLVPELETYFESLEKEKINGQQIEEIAEMYSQIKEAKITS